MSFAPVDLLAKKPALMVGRHDDDLPERTETDVVGGGPGAAGLAAANAATVNGREVIVLNAGSEPGGTANKGGGGFMVTANRFHRDAGIIEDRGLTLRM